MNIWLKKRLVWWFGGALALLIMVGAATRLRAQEGGSETPEKAARQFYQGLLGDSRQSSYTVYATGIVMSSGPNLVISRKSRREMGNGADRLLAQMAREATQPGFDVQTTESGTGTATVQISPASAPQSRPIVCVQEDGVWRVDLVETYAKWNDLKEGEKQQRIYEITRTILPGLPHSESLERSFCQSNLKQIALGIAQYSQDYDEKLPLARNWTDELFPYLKNEKIFDCPVIAKGQRYGYAYNSKLSNKGAGLLSQTALTVSLYETTVLKRNAFGMGENQAFRHLDGANFAFADGHVKWFAKTSKMPSFLLNPQK